MKTELSITVEIMAGAHIDETCEQMQELADRLGVRIAATFNGVDLRARVGGNAQKLLGEYHRTHKDDKLKMAFS